MMTIGSTIYIVNMTYFLIYLQYDQALPFEGVNKGFGIVCILSELYIPSVLACGTAITLIN